MPNRVSRACRGTDIIKLVHYVYIIQNSARKLYVGITKNPEARVAYHNRSRGAKYTKYRSDFQIVFLEEYNSLTKARTREVQIKKWRREKKEILITRYQNGHETKQ